MAGIKRRKARRPPAPARDDALRRLRDEADLLHLENEQLLESQRQLEARLDFYAGAFDASPMACLVLDRAGVVRAASRAAIEFLGQPAAGLIGRSLRLLMAAVKPELLAGHLERCQRDSGLIVTQLELEPTGRQRRFIELSSGRMGGEVPAFPTVLTDITERLAASVEHSSLRASERAARAESEAKDQFIATLSHELRTPLTPVLAAVSALNARETPVAPTRQMLEMIQRNVVAEARLIDDLLDVARIHRGKLRLERHPVDVHETVTQAVEVLAAEAGRKRLEVEVNLEAAQHHASGDALRLRQVFWNLLGNAIKFTPPDGRIGIRSWNRDRVLAVEIRDSGVGLAADTLERLFLPFEQGAEGGRSAGGLGLGLAIAHGVMELHGGRVLAASEGPGTGSRFIVDLDTIPAPQVAMAVEPPPPPSRPGHLRILLVEDHADTAASLAELLIEEGHQVQTAPSAASALACDLDRFDLVVSDLGLPDRSGHDMLRELRARRPLPAIALSGYGTEADIRASREAGFSAHLTKPVDWPELLETIARVDAAAD